MKRLLPLFFLVFLGPLLARAGEKANTVLLHPGEMLYAEFARKGIKLTLVKVSKEKNDQAQVVLSLTTPKPDSGALSFEVDNKFPLDLDYHAQIRSLTEKVRTMVEVYPVVTGKLCILYLPAKTEEVALFGWVLEK